MKPFRAWINQPSIYQPLHKYHGKVGILVKEDTQYYMYFTEGSVTSIQVALSWVARK